MTREGRARRLLAAAGVTLILALAAAAPAAAHPYFVASTPQAGVVAASAPSSLQMAFTEGLTLTGCSITIRDEHGRRVHTGPLHISNGGAGLSVNTGTLAEGIYTVYWVALGDDGHTVSGTFKFGVPNKNGQAPQGAGALLASTGSNGSESAPIESPVSLVGRWLSAVAAFVLVGGALLFVRLRTRVEPEIVTGAERRWRAIALPALAIALIGTVMEGLERANAPASGFDLSVLTSATVGIAVLVRFGVLSACALSLRFVPGRVRPALLAGSGALALGALAVDGHVATVHNLPALQAAVQVIHLVGAGVWIGGVIILAACVAPAALAARRPTQVLAAARAFTVIALPAAVLTCASGIYAAVREGRSLYFVRWTTYGHLLIAKVGVVAIVLAFGGVTTLLARRALRRGTEDTGGRLRWLMRGEAFAAVGAAAVASVLAGTLQGRGQPLPSQRGALLPGAGYADVSLAGGSGIAQMTLAPALPGSNRIVVALAAATDSFSTAPPPPKTVALTLSCGCGRTHPLQRTLVLQPGTGGPSVAWYADVNLPHTGTWVGQLKVNGSNTVGSPTFTVGAPAEAGAPPITIASVADLSGPDALTCRTQELGALYSIEVMNVVGGLDNRKFRQVVLDDGGDPALARHDALALAARNPVAFLAPCGQGASAAIAAVGNRIPTIVADPSVPVTQGARVFRFAAQPYAEGYAAGQYVGKVGLIAAPPTTPRRIAAFVTGPGSQQRLTGLRAALAKYHVDVQTFPASGPSLISNLRHAVDFSSWLGVYLDGPPHQLGIALGKVSAALPQSIEPAPIMTSSRLADEHFVVASGQLGADGQIRPFTDVDPGSAGAQQYVNLAPQVVGELPTIYGLSGFVAGQALAYGMIDGLSPSSIATRLANPGIFSRAATSPWSNRDPATGTLMFAALSPVFLTSNLVPAPGAGNGGSPGEVETGQFFADGDWESAGGLFTPLPVNLANAPELVHSNSHGKQVVRGVEPPAPQGSLPGVPGPLGGAPTPQPGPLAPSGTGGGSGGG